MANNDRRQEIRNEINRTSREEYILKEMQRLGYWPNDQEQPTLQADLIKKREALRSEVRELAKKHKSFENQEAVLNRYKKDRLKKSREKQKENKKKRADERLARAVNWKRRQAKDIIYLGEQYSAGLDDKENDLEKLAKHHLPIVQDIAGLATTLDTRVNELRFLSYYRSVSKVSHYMRYTVPKKSGGVRNISAPMPRLKKVQRAILDEILNKVKLSDSAHGFVLKRSIVTNALPHVGADIIINVDLKDFFPSINYNRVWGVFRGLGFSKQISIVLGLICTEPIEEKIEIDQQFFYVSNGNRVLPQGAPTSPAITNILCRRMDRRLEGLAKKLGFTYSRYADDMTFSGIKSTRQNVHKLLWGLKGIVKDEDFSLHPEKTFVMSNGAKKEVTGIVVNEKVSIARKKMKLFRALLYQIEKDGPKDKRWGESPDVMASILGFARYIHMVDPVKGKKYIDQVQRIRKKYMPKNPTKKKQTDAVGTKKSWWQFWK